MKMMKITAAVLALSSTVAFAEGVESDTSGTTFGGPTIVQTLAKPAAVGIEVGTLGYGANVSWGVTESTELQAGWTGGKIDGDIDVGDNDSWINWNKVLGDDWGDYKGNMKLEVKGNSPYIGTQIRPFKNALTVGTGIIATNLDVNATLTASSDASIRANGTPYDIVTGDVVTVHAEPKNKVAPYLTVGVRPNINSRVGLSAELGAAYVGGYTVETTVNGERGTALGTDIENEIKSDGAKWYPVAKIGATVRF